MVATVVKVSLDKSSWNSSSSKSMKTPKSGTLLSNNEVTKSASFFAWIASWASE